MRREEGDDSCSATERDFDEETGTTTITTTTTTSAPITSPTKDNVEVALVVFPILVAGEQHYPLVFSSLKLMIVSSFITLAFGWNRICILVVLLSQKEKDKNSNNYNRRGGNFGGEKIGKKTFRIVNAHEQSVTEPTRGNQTIKEFSLVDQNFSQGPIEIKYLRDAAGFLCLAAYEPVQQETDSLAGGDCQQQGGRGGGAGVHQSQTRVRHLCQFRY